MSARPKRIEVLVGVFSFVTLGALLLPACSCRAEQSPAEQLPGPTAENGGAMHQFADSDPPPAALHRRLRFPPRRLDRSVGLGGRRGERRTADTRRSALHFEPRPRRRNAQRSPLWRRRRRPRRGAPPERLNCGLAAAAQWKGVRAGDSAEFAGTPPDSPQRRALIPARSSPRATTRTTRPVDTRAEDGSQVLLCTRPPAHGRHRRRPVRPWPARTQFETAGHSHASLSKPARSCRPQFPCWAMRRRRPH